MAEGSRCWLPHDDGRRAYPTFTCGGPEVYGIVRGMSRRDKPQLTILRHLTTWDSRSLRGVHLFIIRDRRGRNLGVVSSGRSATRSSRPASVTSGGGDNECTRM